MPIIIKRTKRTPRLQEGGTIPVYGGYTYKDAQQHTYDPSSLLKKYGTSQEVKEPSKSTGKAAKQLGPKGLENDNIAFLSTYNNLKSEYEKGILGSEYYDQTDRGIALKRELDTFTTAGLQSVLNRKKTFDDTSKLIDNNKTGDDWFFSGGRGAVKVANITLDKDGNKSYNGFKDAFLTTEELDKLSKDDTKAWEKVSVSSFLTSSENDPRFTGELNKLRQSGSVISIGTLDETINNAFKDLGSYSKEVSNTLKNVSIDFKEGKGKELLNEYTNNTMNSTNKAKLNLALGRIKSGLSGPTKDRLTVVALTDRRVNKKTGALESVEEAMNRYLLDSMLSKVEESHKSSFVKDLNIEDTIDDGKLNIGGNKVLDSSVGKVSSDILAMGDSQDQSYELSGENADGATNTVIARTSDGNHITEKMNAEKGTNNGLSTSTVLSNLFDTKKVGFLGNTDVNLDGKANIDNSWYGSYDQAIFNTAVISSSANDMKLSFLPRDTNGNIVKVSSEDLKRYKTGINKAVANFDKANTNVIGEDGKRVLTNSEKADLQKAKLEVAYSVFPGLAPKDINGDLQHATIEPVGIMNIILEKDGLDNVENGKGLKAHKAEISAEDIRNYRLHNSTEVAADGSNAPNTSLSDSADDYIAAPIVVPIKQSFNAFLEDFDKYKIGGNYWGIEQIKAIDDAKTGKLDAVGILALLDSGTK